MTTADWRCAAGHEVAEPSPLTGRSWCPACGEYVKAAAHTEEDK